MKKISVILVLCIISGMLSGCVISDVKDKIVSVVQSKNVLTEKDDTSESNDISDFSKDEKIYSLGDTVKISDYMANLEYTLTDFGSAIGDDGTKAIYFKYYIENTGGDEEYVGPVDFTIYVDDSAINKDYFLRMSGLESSESADIAAGKNTEGIFYIEKDIDTISKLEVRVRDEATYLLADAGKQDDGSTEEYTGDGSQSNDSNNDSSVNDRSDNDESDEVPDLSAEEEYDEHDDYILDSSDSRYITKSEISWMSKKELRLARNEIFARHGYIFNSRDLRDYFSDKNWYEPSISSSDWSDSFLNKYEKKNIALIKKYE